MRTKKTVKLSKGNAEYVFYLNLEAKRIELITRSIFPVEVDTIIGMNLVPDVVQIQLFKKIRQIVAEQSEPASSPRPDASGV